MKKQKATSAPAAVDTKATQEASKIPVEINGKTYNMCFDFQELAKAERFYRAAGHSFHLMFDLPQFTLESLRNVFPCTVRTHHPQLTWEQAQELVTLQSATAIALIVAGALGADTDASVA